MKHALLTTALILSLSTPLQARDIYRDWGGNVLERNAYYKSGRPHRLFGDCFSACTVVLQYPDTCVGSPNATLGFHSASGVGTMNAWMNRAVRKLYPRNVRAWVDAHNALGGSTLKRVKASKFLRRCAS